MTDHPLSEAIVKYAPFILFSYFIAVQINDGKYVETSAIFTALTFASYLIHRSLHHANVPLASPIHMRHHESNHFNKLTDDISETFLNFFVISCGGLLLLLPLSNSHYKLLLYFSLLYTSIHMINYSLLKSNETHIDHHQNPKVNYGPDFHDYLFNTKGNTPLENMTPFCLNSIAIYFFLTFY